MEIVSILVAALGAFAFGAVWYIALSRAWLAAADIAVDAEGRPANAGPMPFVVGMAAMVVVAGMMRHVFEMTAIASPGAGIVAGAGIGAFLVVPWLAMNYAFAQRRAALTVIDGVNAIAGCAVIGLILTLF
jgi:hypothetical protein